MIPFPLADLLTSMITLGKIWRSDSWKPTLCCLLVVSVCIDCFVCQNTVARQRNARNNNADGVSAERVRQSVEQGVAYLKDKRRNGSWNSYRTPGDVSALVTLAPVSYTHLTLPTILLV